MLPKAIKDLCQLSDKDFFGQISIGYKQILKHAISLDDDAQLLAKQKHVTSHCVLSMVAEEEAAKCLILLDAIRCPRQPPDILSKHLENFNEHLAKALYSEACYINVTVSKFEDLIDYINNERKEFYLDGPNDFDWICRNRLVSGREETLYVDYVKMDDGKHIWMIPDKHEFWMKETSFALLLAKAFYETGCTTASSLKIIANFWRGITISPSLTFKELRELNNQTLDELNKHDLLREQPDEIFKTIIDLWMFPMYSLDMKILKDNKEELRRIRRQRLQWLENGENGV